MAFPPVPWICQGRREFPQPAMPNNPVLQRESLRIPATAHLFQRLPELRRDFAQRAAFRLVITKRPNVTPLIASPKRTRLEPVHSSSSSSSSISAIHFLEREQNSMRMDSNLNVHTKNETASLPPGITVRTTPRSIVQTTSRSTVQTTSRSTDRTTPRSIVRTTPIVPNSGTPAVAFLKHEDDDSNTLPWTVDNEEMSNMSKSMSVKPETSQFDTPPRNCTTTTLIATPGIRAFPSPQTGINALPIKRTFHQGDSPITVTVYEDRRPRPPPGGHQSGPVPRGREAFSPEEEKRRLDERIWMETRWRELAALKVARGLRSIQDATCRMIRRAVDALDKGERWSDFMLRKKEVISEIHELRLHIVECKDVNFSPGRRRKPIVTTIRSPSIEQYPDQYQPSTSSNRNPPPGWKACRINPKPLATKVRTTTALSRKNLTSSTKRIPLVADLNNSTHRNVIINGHASPL